MAAPVTQHKERGDPWKRALDFWIGRPLIRVLRPFIPRRRRPAEIANVGLLMLGAIGDTIIASAIAHDLRRAFPAAKISAVVSRANKGTLDLLDGFDDVASVDVSRPDRCIGLLRGKRFDVLIDIGQWARISALIAMLSRSRFTVGFDTPGQSRQAAFDATVEHSAACHELENFRRLLTVLGLEGIAKPRIKSDVLVGTNPLPLDAYVVLHPWAAGYMSGQREWHAANWIALGRLLHGWGYRIVITGGPQDVQRAGELGSPLSESGAVEIAAGRSSLRDTARLLQHAAAVVSVNTGVMHLAAVFDRPMVALHGPTNALRWGPLSDAAVVVGPGPDAGGGFLNLGFEYPPEPPDCMSRISVAEVAGHLRTMLGTTMIDSGVGRSTHSDVAERDRVAAMAD